MKIALLLFCITLTPNYAQNVKKQIVEEVCNCINNINIDEEIQRINVNVKDCFLNSVKANIEDLKKGITSEEEFIRLNNDVMSQVQYCNPHNFNLLKRVYNELIMPSMPETENDTLFERWSTDVVKISKTPIEYKVGKFKMLNAGNEFSIIMRDVNYQYEIVPVINDALTFSVKWINDYEYDLTFVRNQTEYHAMTEGHIYKIKIVEVTNNSFISFTKNISLPGSEVARWEFMRIE